MQHPSPARAVLDGLRGHALAVDAALMAPLILTAAVVDGHSGEHLVVTLGLTAPLIWRRAAPVTSAAVVAAFALLEVLALDAFLVGNVAVLFSVYALAAHAPRWAAAGGLVVALLGAGLAGVVFFGDSSGSVFVTTGIMSLLAVVAAVLGLARRTRLAHADTPAPAPPGTSAGRTAPPPPEWDFEVRLAEAVSWLRGHPLVVDAVIAGALALLLVPTGVAMGSDGGLFLSAALVVPLAWRRMAPAASAACVAAAALLEVVLSSQFLPANVAVLVAVYSLAAYAPRWARYAGLVTALFGALLAAVRYGPDTATDLILLVLLAVSAVAAYALGIVRRARLQHLEQLAERARLLEVERENESRLAATTERQRIAREMHDVVAHSLSVIIAQADGGRYAGRSDPQAAVAALETIAGTGRQALTDMRSLLGVLRQDPGSELLPQPDATQIPALVESVRRSGLDVDVSVEGEPRPLPPGPGLAAYRIVQESLTNVLKHSGPASRAAVLVRWEADRLRLVVIDDGRGAAAAGHGRGSGQGIRGMAERAHLHGGRLSAGPRPGGGFEVQAELPYPRGS
ncbi:signal transduction histidine kinase [Kineococcus xinjiangensis]|uniref:histidine kinase n=1 Tax=Kineococcus xinjiangensis TaxID=512762 RepID=A0A2S6IW38_9ACTN|nr:histidine kinase [Kineococcus xinjiangensis]PPK98574.1 signal transduction histidine kinase [Kineococcus xinjiangensis]